MVAGGTLDYTGRFVIISFIIMCKSQKYENRPVVACKSADDL